MTGSRDRAGRVAQPALAWLESRPFGALWLGLGLAAGIVALYAFWSLAFGSAPPIFDTDEPFALHRRMRIHVVIALLTAFLVATGRYDARRSEQDLVRLRPLTSCSDAEFAAILGALARFDRRQLAAVLLFGLAVGVAMIPATLRDPASLLAASAWDMELVWAVLANVALFAVMGRGAVAALAGRRALEAIARALSRIDLLDRRSLQPFARQGLRRAFYWAGGSSIASLLALDLQRLWPLFATLAATVVLATVALWDPARVVRLRLREAKRAELARVRTRIERAKEAALRPRSAGAAGEAALLPGLLAYEVRIEGVSEWPFDAPTLLRFGALLLLATGSWLGGAIVERLLGSVLD